VCSSLLYHYSTPAPFASAKSDMHHPNAGRKQPHLKVVGASVKNSIFFCEDGRYENFIKRYSTNYAANKAHCKFNLCHWAGLHDPTLLKGIKKRNWDDVADAFMMIMGWLSLEV
jgi:hypothetical protein